MYKSTSINPFCLMNLQQFFFLTSIFIKRNYDKLYSINDKDHKIYTMHKKNSNTR